MLKQEQVEFLDSKLVNFFPESGSWNSRCFQKSPLIEECNLPCHLRDTNWLAKMIIKKYNITNMDTIAVAQYINESDYFKQARHDYEQRIVSWQINFMLNGGEGWIVDDKLGGDFYKLGPYSDYAFRKGIVDTLLAINMDITAIEEGIEKNVEKWRENLVRLAFHNTYNPYRFGLFNAPKMSNPSEEHRQLWTKMRLYEYYQKHKSSVDAYGVVTEEMKMTAEEVSELEEKLNKMNEERQKEVDEYSNNLQQSIQGEAKMVSEQPEEVDKPKGLRKIFKGFCSNKK